MSAKATVAELKQRLAQLERENTACRQAEEKYRAILESIEEGYYEVDLAGNFTFFNDSLCRILEYDREEMLGKNNREYMDADNSRNVFQTFNTVYLTGKPTQVFDWQIISKNGHRRFVEASVSLRRDKDGRPVGFQGIVRDITHRKRTEETLRLFQFSLERTADAAFWIRPDASFVYVNEAACRALGYTRQELLSMTVHDVDPNFTETVWPDHWEEVKQRGAFTVESHHCAKDGRVFPVEIALNYLKFEGKEFNFAFARDISDRKRAEDALRESEERLKAIFEASPEPVVVYDGAGHPRYLNPVFTEVFGWSLDELKGQRIPFVPEDQKEITAAKIRELFQSGKTVRMETKRYTKSGAVLDILVSAAPVKGPDGQRGGMVVTLTDITRKKDLEAQLQQAQKLEAIGTLAGGIAHDFNNILSPILGYAEMIMQDLPRENPIQKQLDAVFEAASRGRDLVRQIMAFSRHAETELTPIKLQPIVTEALKLLRSSIPANIDIQSRIADDCGVVMADPTQIHQIMMNLGTNAYHALGEDGGTLTVSLAQVDAAPSGIGNSDLSPGPYALLSLADDGVGMTPDVLQKAFDPYFTTKTNGKGTGLGLSVVHGIVKNCGGDIRVWSDPGMGSTFQVYLPINASGSDQRASYGLTSLEGGTEAILLVDDEETIVNLEKQMLERLGYRVTARTSSVEALEAFRTAPRKFDLVLTDMMMPNMTGVQLSREIRKIRSEIPIIVVTGYSEQIDENKIKALGIQGYVMKPVILKQIAATIRQVIGG